MGDNRQQQQRKEEHDTSNRGTSSSRFSRSSEKDERGGRTDAPPLAVNSRFSSAADTDRNERDERKQSRAAEGASPPLVVNSRLAATADTDRSRHHDRRDRDDTARGPPPQVVNSRFAAAADADRKEREERRAEGPPPVATNTRFAAAADADRKEREERMQRRAEGPPPVATNSRFAAAADLDRKEREERMQRRAEGPPPVAISRFAAAADADRSRNNERREDQGPPPVTNSRFANAAAMAEQEGHRDDDRRGGNRADDDRRGGGRYDDDRRGGGGGRYDDRGPPAAQQNTRFSNAVAADGDYVDRGERIRRDDERARDREERGYGGGGGSGGGGSGGGRFGRAGGGGGGDRGRNAPLPTGPRGQEDDYEGRPLPQNQVDKLLQSKIPKKDETILVPLTKEHEANMLQFPAKALSKDRNEDILTTPKKGKKQEPANVTTTQPEPATDHNALVKKQEELLNKFASGNKQGDELKEWVQTNKDWLPPVEKLVFQMLEHREKLNPDPDCAWAEPAKYGSALLSLVEDDLLAQMQVLWGIQLYCEKLGFPKLNDEYVCQAMFRAMYKFDLATDDAFVEWKDDESDAHEKGKMTAVIQTVDWFNWLEEDNEDEAEEDEAEDDE
jgi:hypothetical protein